MRKILPSTLLAAAAVGALLVLPTGTASAMSPACNQASDVINNNRSLGPDAALTQSISDQLLAIDASGQEQQAIANYAHALTNGDVASVGNASTILNGVCQVGS
ncbi:MULTISPECIES: hypothetical protein [unclassified Nocardia]|uniref:hypothetical protein n=1 Tax=unclassified Nocardia TaxID=2637762 RepID=UPI0026324339|nr:MULTISPECIES: hypothetical protein [unclassified Nocardia]MCU1640122.1 hypothetical protein [Nocardia sp.]WSJ18228.1 hypothetical protein OG326_12815 [Nocardia sp. NBC_01327]